MNRNDRAIVAFSGLAHATVHTYELSIPILVVIWLAEFSATTAEMGLVLAVGYGLFGIGALPGGVLADRFGSRRVITGCLVGMAASFVLLSAASGVVMIGLAVGVWGVAASVYHPAGLSLLSTGVRNRGTGFAYHGMAGNVGIAFGPLATAVLLLAFDWRVVALLLVVPAVGAVAYALTAEFDETAATGADGDEVDSAQPASVRQFLANSRSLFTVAFTVAMVIVMMNGLFYRGTLTFLPDVLGPFLRDVSGTVQLFDPGSPMAEAFDPASYLYAGLLTVGIGGQYLGGKLTDRIPPTAGLAVGFAILAVVSLSFVPLAEAGVVTLLGVSCALGVVLFALQPMYQATIAEYSPPGDRGLSYGYTYLASFGVGAAGAAIAGYLLSVVAVGGTFVALAAFPVIGAVLAAGLFRSELE